MRVVEERDPEHADARVATNGVEATTSNTTPTSSPSALGQPPRGPRATHSEATHRTSSTTTAVHARPGRRIATSQTIISAAKPTAAPSQFDPSLPASTQMPRPRID